MSSRGNTVFTDTVATASAPLPEFLPNTATISATGIISLYDQVPILCLTTLPAYFYGFGAACSQISGSFSGGYVINPNPGLEYESKGTLIVGFNIGVFDKTPVVTWCPASPTAGIVCDAYQAYGESAFDPRLTDGSYFFGIYVGATTWPELDPSWTGPDHRIDFNFNIFG